MIEQEVKEDIEEHRMILCVRTDLGMGKGKIAAQCGHACLGVYRKVSEIYKKIINGNDKQHKVWLDYWDNNLEAKIAVKIKDEEEMDKLYLIALSADVPAYIITDCGRTQIKEGSKTVLSIGPAPVLL
jgi:PTH2 family peptidyl-tRNA hydrolase